MKFTLTTDTPDLMERPGIKIAQMLREAAAVIEAQVPLMDHHHVYDIYGLQKYEWTMEQEGTPPEAARCKPRSPVN